MELTIVLIMVFTPLLILSVAATNINRNEAIFTSVAACRGTVVVAVGKWAQEEEDNGKKSFQDVQARGFLCLDGACP